MVRTNIGTNFDDFLNDETPVMNSTEINTGNGDNSEPVPPTYQSQL